MVIVPATRAYKNYLLGMMLVILACNYVERQALGLLLQSIKVELALSDTQLGFLTGIAFALFYSVLGIPIARWADRGNRITIISIATALASAGVALCGLAASFMQLLLIRIGVAVGEAGCVPPAHSLIATYFNRAERPKAVAIYKLGAPLSVVIGYFLAGWLNEFYGWRVAFMVLGLPGLGLSLIAWFTLREPRRAMSATAANDNSAVVAAAGQQSAVAEPQPSLAHVCKTLWANTTFRHLLLAYSVSAFFTFGLAQWNPTFFIRTYGLRSGELGTWYAIIAGVGGLLGTYLGGVLVARYAAKNERLQLQALTFLFCSYIVISICKYLSPNAYLAFTLMAITSVGLATIAGPFFAMLQSLVPDSMRAMSIALLFLFANLIGMGFGPLAAGALSDAFRPWFGEDSLRYALLTLCPGYLWCAWHFWQASKTVSRDLEAAQREEHDRVVAVEEAPAAGANRVHGAIAKATL